MESKLALIRYKAWFNLNNLDQIYDAEEEIYKSSRCRSINDRTAATEYILYKARNELEELDNTITYLTEGDLYDIMVNDERYKKWLDKR